MNEELSAEDKALLNSQLEALKGQLTGDIFGDGEVMDQILEIELKLGLIKKNSDSPQECIGCGS